MRMPDTLRVLCAAFDYAQCATRPEADTYATPHIVIARHDAAAMRLRITLARRLRDGDAPHKALLILLIFTSLIYARHA